MKFFLLSGVLTLLLTGCTTKNAFSELGLSLAQEKAIESTRNEKMRDKEEVGGLFSVIYLNNIHKELPKDTQEFYLAIYAKNGYDQLHFTLNGANAVDVSKLPKENEYSKLLTMKNQWSQEYLLSFKTPKEKQLTLLIGNGRFSSGLLEFVEDPQ